MVVFEPQHSGHRGQAELAASDHGSTGGMFADVSEGVALMQGGSSVDIAWLGAAEDVSASSDEALASMLGTLDEVGDETAYLKELLEADSVEISTSSTAGAASGSDDSLAPSRANV